MAENQPSESSQRPAKKKTHPFKIALIIVSLLLALLVLKAVLMITAKPTISFDYVAELNQISKPTNYDPSENAALDYQKAINSLVEEPQQIVSTSINWPSDMNDRELNVLKQYVNSNNEALEHLKRGSLKPYCWTKDFYPDNNLAKPQPAFKATGIRKLTDLNILNAKLNAINNQSNDVVNNLIITFRLGSHFMGPKSTFYQIMGIAVKSLTIRHTFIILDRSRFDPKTLKYFQEQLQLDFNKNENDLNFRCEKLLIYDFIQRVFTNDGRGNGHLIPRLIAKWVILVYSTPGREKTKAEIAWDRKRRLHEYATIIWKAFIGPDKQQTTAMTDRFLSYCEAIKNKTPWQFHSEGITLQKQIERMIESYYVLQIEGYGYHRLIEMYQRCKAKESALITTISLLRYKADKGQLPENLDILVATGYLKELPMDPYSDEPLVYKSFGNDFVLYSLGADFDDDGGTPSKWGEGEQGGDQVFWPVEKHKKVKIPEAGQK